jgi:conjugative relaxase-like TrwC/TraI family protein
MRRNNGKETPNRRIFYDFTFSPPKSVSVVAMYQDARIVESHDWAVRSAMAELEKFAETRVRKSGQFGERPTGEVVAACFQHDTSRELDPHLHTHGVVFNATFDPVEQRWKALDTHGMYRSQKYVENLYFHELCKGLRSLGYMIENNARNFEIKGVPATVIARFSKRHQQIEVEARKQVARDGFCGNIAELRERVAHDKRRRKMRDSTAGRLRAFWAEQLAADEKAALSAVRPSQPGRPDAADVRGIVAWADEHLFERKAIVFDHELWSAALARGRGTDLDLPAVVAEIERRGYIREKDTRRLTSPEVLRCELAVVLAARDGRNGFAPLNPGCPLAAGLAGEQRTAVERILKSRDFITLFRGGAGTGKSYTLREVRRGIEAAGRSVVVLAPQRQQVASFLADGLPASTVAQCLRARVVPPRSVVLVDEAGQIGARQLSELVTLVRTMGGRLILSGDIRQHGAVETSDALRAIEQYSGLTPAILQQIRRQDPSLAKSLEERVFIAAYRDAVKAASAGRIAESFDRLDRMGCICEAGTNDRLPMLAREYLASAGRNERALIVAQTWGEVNRVNDAVRAELRATGKVGDGVVLKTYQALDLGEAQKRDGRFYEPGQFAYVLKRYGRLLKGDLCAIAGTNARGVVLIKNGRRSTMSYRRTGGIVVAIEKETEVAPGDRLQLKFNGKSREARPIVNGELVTVRRVQADGSVVVDDDGGTIKTLAPGQRLLNRGYAVTSYSSQGKTVDAVLVSDSGCKAATNSRHWYVAISRARKRVQVFTEDKAELRANVCGSGEDALALEINPSPPDPTAFAKGAWNRAERRKALGIVERARLHRAVIELSRANKEREWVAI